MTNYNPVNKTKQIARSNKHREELLLALHSTSWETFKGDGRSDNHKRSHIITLDPIGLAYLALLDSEIASYDNVPSDIKVVLIKYLSFYFDRLITWRQSTRGRKIGIFGNLSLGYVMHTQDSKTSVSVEFYRYLSEENTWVFRIDCNGSGFAKFNGYLFIHNDGKIYQMSDDRISDLQENE